MERKPEVPASPRGEALFRCTRPSGKGFGIVNKAEIDVFLELSCFFHDPEDVANLISGSSAFSKSSLNIWKLMAHVYRVGPLSSGVRS